MLELEGMDMEVISGVFSMGVEEGNGKDEADEDPVAEKVERDEEAKDVAEVVTADIDAVEDVDDNEGGKNVQDVPKDTGVGGAGNNVEMKFGMEVTIEVDRGVEMGVVGFTLAGTDNTEGTEQRNFNSSFNLVRL